MVKIYIWITRRENMYIAYQFFILTSDWSIRIKLNRRRFWVGHWYFVNKETMFWSLVTQNDISMFINNQILRYDSFLWLINNPKFPTNQDDLPGNQSETSINLIFFRKTQSRFISNVANMKFKISQIPQPSMTSFMPW